MIGLDDLGPALEIAEDAAARQNPIQTFADLKMLYSLVQQAQAGKLSIGGMARAGTLKSTIAALAREATLLQSLMNDPAEEARIVKLASELP